MLDGLTWYVGLVVEKTKDAYARRVARSEQRLLMQ